MLKDEQGDEIVTIENRDQFKDKPKTTAPPVPRQLELPVPPQRSTLDIEGMDPLFMEAVGP